MTLEERLQIEIGRMLMDILALQHQNEELRAALPKSKSKPAPETK